MDYFIHLWAKEVNGLRLENILNLYGDDAKLFPTFSPEILTDKQAIRQYFEKLVSYKGITCEAHEVYQDCLGDEYWKESGLYTFAWINENGEKISHKARFIFIYSKKGDRYSVLEHQSNRLFS